MWSLLQVVLKYRFNGTYKHCTTIGCTVSLGSPCNKELGEGRNIYGNETKGYPRETCVKSNFVRPFEKRSTNHYQTKRLYPLGTICFHKGV